MGHWFAPTYNFLGNIKKILEVEAMENKKYILFIDNIISLYA
jgi:hypothetical protein